MAQPYLDHIKTYTIPIEHGKGELLKVQLPLEKAFMDRIVLFSNNITEAELNNFFVRLVHSGAELFGEDTSARFFSANDTIPSKEKGFTFPFDIKSAKTLLDISLKSALDGLSGTIYITIFYRDMPLISPTIITN